jgi:F-type H+-transporting ATPase subunit epsilon
VADQQHFLRLEVVDPDGPVFQGDVGMVILPAYRGELGILPQHAAMVTQLATGAIRVQTLDDTWLYLAVSGGFAKVQFDKVIVLADSAELATEIDVERARRSLSEAEERLAMVKEGRSPEGEDIDPYMETKAAERAKNRLKVVSRT